jgi:cytochrome bd-type quinol oxidase subunit 1
MRLFSWRGILGLGCGLGLVLFWILVALRIATDPGNHISVSVLCVIPLALVAMLAGALWREAQYRRAGMALLVLGLLTVLGVVLLDWLDILVEYESWLKRGMPARPF